MSKIAELFGHSTISEDVDWTHEVAQQHCTYLGKTCIKVRKSFPDISIGTCSVFYGRERRHILICPFRLLERRQIFIDCLHLLTNHQPGNELHVVPEITIPGGNVDYFLASARGNRIRDFVGIELQTLDTTGTVWPSRQRFIHSVGLETDEADRMSPKPFGMNWKMTAKTILIQLHHKIQTFEYINKHLVLVVQDHLLEYLKKEFSFDHLEDAHLGNPMHVHAYALSKDGQNYRIDLAKRLSTDSDGIAVCLGLQSEAKVELKNVLKELERKISAETRMEI